VVLVVVMTLVVVEVLVVIDHQYQVNLLVVD
jgi:hypothetical protein